MQGRWHRFVEKYGGVWVSHVKPSNCFRLHPTSMISKLDNPDSWQPVGASKNQFCIPSLTQVFHPWWRETCRVIQQQFWMKECDIGLFKTYSDLLHIFRGQDPPNPQDLRPCTGLVRVLVTQLLINTYFLHYQTATHWTGALHILWGSSLCDGRDIWTLLRNAEVIVY